MSAIIEQLREMLGYHRSLEMFSLAENETCSEVLRADWPTRVNDLNCSQRALAVCMHPGCEAPLCAVHVEQCPACLKEFCNGCLEDHLAIHGRKVSA